MVSWTYVFALVNTVVLNISPPALVIYNTSGSELSLRTSVTLDPSAPFPAPEPQPQCDLHPGLFAERRPERSERGE